MNSFDLKKYLTENKLTSNSKRLSMLDENIYQSFQEENIFLDQLKQRDLEYIFGKIDQALRYGILDDTSFDGVLYYLRSEGESILPFEDNGGQEYDEALVSIAEMYIDRLEAKSFDSLDDFDYDKMDSDSDRGIVTRIPGNDPERGDYRGPEPEL